MKQSQRWKRLCQTCQKEASMESIHERIPKPKRVQGSCIVGSYHGPNDASHQAYTPIRSIYI